MLDKKELQVFTVHLESKTVMANACCSNEKEAIALVEELSSRYCYDPVVLQGPDGLRHVYLEGEFHENYSKDHDETLKGELK